MIFITQCMLKHIYVPFLKLYIQSNPPPKKTKKTKQTKKQKRHAVILNEF